MSDLRWVLIGLGALIIGLIWLAGSGRLKRLIPGRGPPADGDRRIEPIADEVSPGGVSTDQDGESAASEESEESEEQVPAGKIDRVITVRFVPRQQTLRGDTTVLALRAAGLRHGQYGIFHMFADESSRDSMFSVANLTEPGSFDLSNLSESKIPGMNFFLVLPGRGDPVERFDRMVDTARELARALDADLRDERGSSWSIQRERYVREELIEYRHEKDGPAGR